jgi:hypothetical protein
VANGHIYPQIDQVRMNVFYREPLVLFHNNRDGTFRDVTRSTTLQNLPLQSRRGMAFGDINNDGKLDVLILNVGERPTLLLNCTQNSNHAVLLKLIGTKSNRSGIGARVTVSAGDLRQMKEVRSGSSYLSQNDLRLHFGLGSHAKVDSIEIQWPSGNKEIFSSVATNSIYVIKEGTGIDKGKRFLSSTGCGATD